jgi:hypothetical protein
MIHRRMRCYGFTGEVSSGKVNCGCYSVLGLSKEDQMADVIDVPTRGKGLFDKLSENVYSADGMRLCLTASYVGPKNISTSQKSGAGVNCLDDRTIKVDQLRAKACENNILSAEQQELYGVLIKYQQHLTNRPDRFNVFEYEFKIEGDMPPTAN